MTSDSVVPKRFLDTILLVYLEQDPGPFTSRSRPLRPEKIRTDLGHV